MRASNVKWQDFDVGREARQEFKEIFTDASLEACAARDPKGLYARAMKGEIRNFTGIDSPYERPGRPDLRLDTEQLSARQCVELVLQKLM